MNINLNNFANAVLAQEKAIDKATSVLPLNTLAAAGTKAIGAVKGVAPVTNNKFNAFVEKANADLGNLDARVWNTEFQIAMIAQAAGITLPSEEQMAEYRKQWLEEEAARIKAEEEAKKAEEAVNKPVGTAEALFNAMTDPAIAQGLKDALMTIFGLKLPVATEEAPQAAEQPLLKDDKALDEYMTGGVKEEEKPEPKKEEKPVQKKEVTKKETPKAKNTEKKNPKEWKQCVECNRDISVVYKGDTCPHCKRTKEAAKAKETGKRAPRPRIQFDN